MVYSKYNTNKSIAELGEISRGILPLDYLSSISSDEDWYQNLENELAKKSIRDTKVSLRKIGGFSLLYGKLDINHNTGKINHLNILSNRGDRGRVHDSMLAGACPTDEELKSHEDVAYQTTFGLSNSLFYKPWKKVDIGKSRLEELVSKSIVENYTHDELIQHCFDDILSYNTFDAEAADKAQTLEDKFLELRKSIFIPPLKTGVSKPLKSSFVGSYYGTRTQTVIALHKSGVLHYYEHDIHDSDELSKEFKVKKQHFQIPLSVPQ